MSGHSTILDEPLISTKNDQGGSSGSGIRCPLCGWEPQENSRWICKCGHIWNVFDTGGVCPGCLHRGKKTQCGECGRYSLHSDWYEHKE